MITAAQAAKRKKAVKRALYIVFIWILLI